MRRILLLLALATLALGLAPARAGLTVSAGLARGAHYELFDYNPMTDSQRFEYFAVSTITSGVLAGTTATPTADAIAAAYSETCDQMGCTSVSFPTQAVSLTALTMDPLGNTVGFRACLIPQTGPCRNFDLTFSRPEYLSPQICNPLIVCLNVNAWFDPATNASKATAYEAIGLYRASYTVSGTFGGSPFVPASPPYGFVFADSGQTLIASEVLTQP